MSRVSILVLMLFVVITKTFARDFSLDETLNSLDVPPQQNDVQELTPDNLDEEYIRHIHSMINAYRSDMLGGRLVIETNALIDTKYRTWKRNADLINSLLALPKGMDEAGR